VSAALHEAGLPAFDELPVLPETSTRHAWGLFGAEDELGTLNLLTPDIVRAGLACAESGERVGLSLPSDVIDPPLWGRRPTDHHFLEAGPVVDEWLDAFYPQAGSQWDGFGHHRCRAGAYGGVTEPPGPYRRRLSIHHWAEQGIVSRGVLLDVARYRGGAGDPLAEGTISAGRLAEVARAQGILPRRGDVLCVRTGWLAAYREAVPAARERLALAGTALESLGLSAAEDTARLLWNWQVAAVVTDNPAVEQTPGDPAVGSLHRRLLMSLGMPLGELFDLDRLAARCAAEDRWTFAFFAVPLALVGGVGSTANALAVR
jgi:kynurenine formamidase